ncbi:MAG: helix-turn-helix transcriptional regulator [Deltaproteobacteria bacterium]|nr:helix-turn-helix transcriptional regulator [Deltaproteobacteria bacterium]
MQKTFVDIIENNLNDIISPFLQGMGSWDMTLTPTEIQVANFIKQQKTTKEIAEMLNISISTIVFHRHNIRKKLGLVKKKINLQSYLQST